MSKCPYCGREGREISYKIIKTVQKGDGWKSVEAAFFARCPKCRAQGPSVRGIVKIIGSRVEDRQYADYAAKAGREWEKGLRPAKSRDIMAERE